MLNRMNLVALTVVGVLVCVQAALKLPTYITPCSLSDPKLNDCALKNGRKAFPSIIKGDPKFHVQPLSPLYIPEMVIDSNKDLSIRLKNSKIYGLENTDIHSVSIDMKKRKIAAKVFIPRVNLQGEYDITGRILVLPISGNGPCNFTFVDGTYIYHFNMDLVDKNGREHGKVASHFLDYDTKRAYFQLDNLFGNKQLSDSMNRILDENWEVVTKDIGPAVTEAVSIVITSIFENLLERVPLNEIFLP